MPKRRSAGPVTSSCSRKLIDAERQVERAEEARQRVGVAVEALVGDQAELERASTASRSRSRKTSAAISRRYGLAAICRMASRSGSRLGAPGRVATLRRMRVLATATITAAEQNQRRQHQQHVDRAADRPDQVPRQHAAGDGAERRAGADQPEQPLRLPRVEQRVREAPRLDRRDDAETVDPDEEHAGSSRNGWKRKAYQKPRTFDGKEQQRHDASASRVPDAGDGAARTAARKATARSAPRRRRRPASTGRTASRKSPLRIGLASRNEATTSRDVEEGEKDRKTLARPDVEEPAQPRNMDSSAVYFSFCIA